MHPHHVIGTIQSGLRESCRVASTGERLTETLDLTASSGIGRFIVHHERLAIGNRSSSPHSHSSRDELVFILKGTPDVVIDGERRTLQPGDYVALPAGTGVAHHLENRGQEDVEYLLVASSGEVDEVAYPPSMSCAADG